MNYSLVFNSEAEKEYRDAYIWYEEKLSGLGERFENEVASQIDQILSNPKTFHFCKGRFRECAIPGFPYTIVYAENSAKRTVYVTAVYHSSRDPKLKYRKQK